MGNVRSIFLSTLLVLSLSASHANAQGLTGQISGTVIDPSNSAITSATLTVVNQESRQSRTTKTNNEGRYVFSELLPGTFTLTVDAPGFKRFEQTEVVVTANERVTLPVTLQVGSLNEIISVVGEVVQVQTESAERSGLITSREMQEIPLKGRSYMGTTKLLPGIIDTANRESPGWNDLV